MTRPVLILDEGMVTRPLEDYLSMKYRISSNVLNPNLSLDLERLSQVDPTSLSGVIFDPWLFSFSPGKSYRSQLNALLRSSPRLNRLALSSLDIHELKPNGFILNRDYNSYLQKPAQLYVIAKSLGL